MTTSDQTPAQPIFDCRARRHKVLAGDGICVLCGRRGVIDARRLPPMTNVPVSPPPTILEHIERNPE